MRAALACPAAYATTAAAGHPGTHLGNSPGLASPVRETGVGAADGCSPFEVAPAPRWVRRAMTIVCERQSHRGATSRAIAVPVPMIRRLRIGLTAELGSVCRSLANSALAGELSEPDYAADLQRLDAIRAVLAVIGVTKRRREQAIYVPRESFQFVVFHALESEYDLSVRRARDGESDADADLGAFVAALRKQMRRTPQIVAEERLFVPGARRRKRGLTAMSPTEAREARNMETEK